MRLAKLLRLASNSLRAGRKKKRSTKRANLYRLGQFSSFENLEDRRLLAIIDITTPEISTNTVWNSSGDTYRLMTNVTVRGGATLTIGPNVIVSSPGGWQLRAGTDGTMGNIVVNDATVNSRTRIGSLGSIDAGDSSFTNETILNSGAGVDFQNNTFNSNVLYVAPELIDNLGSTSTYGTVASPNGTIFVIDGNVSTSMTWPALPGLARYNLNDFVVVRNNSTLTIGGNLAVNSPAGYRLNVGTDGTAGTIVASNVSFGTRVRFGAQGSATITNSIVNGETEIFDGAAPVFTNTTFAPTVLSVDPNYIDNLGSSNAYGSTSSPNGTIYVLGNSISTSMTWPALPGLARYDLRDFVAVRNNATLTISDNLSVDSPAGYRLNVGNDGTAGSVVANNVSFGTRVRYGSQSSATITNSIVNGNTDIFDGAAPVFSNTSFAPAVLYVDPNYIDNLGATNTYGSTTSPNGTIYVLGNSISSSMTWPAYPGLTRYDLQDFVAVRNSATLTIAPNLTLQSPAGYRLNVGNDGTDGRLEASNVSIASRLRFGPSGSGNLSNATFTGQTDILEGANPTITNSSFAPAILYVAPSFIDDLSATNTYGSTTSPNGTIFVLGGSVSTSMEWPALPGLTKYNLQDFVLVGGNATLTIASNLTLESPAGYRLEIGTGGSSGNLNANNVSFTSRMVFGANGGGTINGSFVTGQFDIRAGANPAITNTSFAPTILFVAPEFVDDLSTTNSYGSLNSPNGTINILEGNISEHTLWNRLPGANNFNLRDFVVVRNGARLTIAPYVNISSPSGYRLNVGTDGTVGRIEAFGVNFALPVNLGANSFSRIEHSNFNDNDLIIDGNNDANTTFRFNDLSNIAPGKVTLTSATGGSATTFDLARNFWGTTNLATIDTLVVDNEENAFRPTGSFSPVIAPGTIGRAVWQDVDQDGVFDSNEPGIQGIPVKLYSTSNTLIASTTTAAGGAYQFLNVPTGNYYVEYTLTDAQRQTFTLPATIHEFLDSDVDSVSGLVGKSDSFAFNANSYNFRMDAGVLISEPPVIGGLANVAYAENAPAINVASSATISDVDSSNFNNGRLSLTLSAGGDSTDRLGIRQASGITLSGNQVLLNAQAIGTFTGGIGTAPLVITLNGNADAAKTQTLLRNLTYKSLSENPSVVKQLTVQLTDGDGGTSLPGVFDVLINPSNDAPVLTVGGSVTYVENAAPLILASTATVTDSDSPNFDTGILTLGLTSNGQMVDVLDIRNEGTGAGQIGVAGTDVTFGGVVIGTKSGGTGLTPLVVTLNASATVEATRALLRNTTFVTPGETPNPTQRTVTISLTDGDGATSLAVTKLVNVSPRNDLPVIAAIGSDLSFIENGTPIRLTTTATISDVDSTDFDGGQLTVLLSANARAEDRLAIINAGAISVVNNEVFFNGVALGTFTGGVGTAPLVVTLNATATPSRVQSLIRTITYSNVSENPSSAVRTLTFRVSDGDGGTSVSASKSIVVTPRNDAPVIGAIGPDLNYIENGAPIRLTTTGTVTDVDSANLDQGKLTVLFTVNAKPEDRLTIINAGAISVSGNEVLFSGVVMGTFTGGVGSTPLVVTFNSTASPTTVQSLIRTITYSNVSENPSAATRTLTFRLTDGDGGTSADTSKFINVAPRNDASVLGGISGARNYVNNTAGILLATNGPSTIATATVTDVDSTNFDTGRLTIVATAGGHSSNRIELSGTVFTLDASNNVLRNGTIIGTLNANGGVGTTRFEVTFNAQATPAIVQQLLRVITFRTTSTQSVAQRVFSFTLTDGDGGTSNVLSKTINVS